jgi:hypothetical protein
LIAAPRRSKAEIRRRRLVVEALQGRYVEAQTRIGSVPVEGTPPEAEFVASLQIEDKAAGGLIPFKLWGFQKELIEMLKANDRLVVLKARQLGITWVVLAHALYSGTFWGNRLFLIVSLTGDDAIA